MRRSNLLIPSSSSFPSGLNGQHERGKEKVERNGGVFHHPGGAWRRERWRTLVGWLRLSSLVRTPQRRRIAAVACLAVLLWVGRRIAHKVGEARKRQKKRVAEALQRSRVCPTRDSASFTELPDDEAKTVEMRRLLEERRHWRETQSPKSWLPVPPSAVLPSGETPRCALLFFGLARGNFVSKVLPNIRRFLLDVNPTCDVFIHNYNVTMAAQNPRSKELNVTIPDPLSVRALTSNIVLDTEDEFQAARDLSLYRKHFPFQDNWIYPTSMDNMIRQWHALERVWDLMAETERSQHGGQNYYQRVGLFRSDVLYVNPIDIMEGGDAVLAYFAASDEEKYWNDRLFYGSYRHARVFAKERFSYVDAFIKRPVYKERRLHSESFLYELLYEKVVKPQKEIAAANGTAITAAHVIYQNPNICVNRVRGTGEVLWADCCELFWKP